MQIKNPSTAIFFTRQEDQHNKGFHRSSAVFTGQGPRTGGFPDVCPIQKSFGSSKRDWKPGKKLLIPCKFCPYRFIGYSSTCYSKVCIDPLMANIRNPGGCFTNISRALQNILSKFVYRGNRNSYENFKLKLCMCAQSHALGTHTKFRLEILTLNVISSIVDFRDIILESSRNVSETTPWLFCLPGGECHPWFVVVRHVSDKGFVQWTERKLANRCDRRASEWARSRHTAEWAQPASRRRTCATHSFIQLSPTRTQPASQLPEVIPYHLCLTSPSARTVFWSF